MARRFITFIDVLYEHKVGVAFYSRQSCSSPPSQIRMIASAAGSPEELFRGLDSQYAASTADHEDIYRDESKDKVDSSGSSIGAKQVKKGEVSFPRAVLKLLQLPFLCCVQLSGMTDLAFAYHRAVSRLTEMQSEKFWDLVGKVEKPSKSK